MTFDDLRSQMVERQLARRGISDRRVLRAFRRVPRERFVPPALVKLAYADSPLPIGEGQTISQPYVVALTVEALRLRGHERVLEIGSGTGYAAAVLSLLAEQVVAIERIESLAIAARDRLARLGYHNVLLIHADGTVGWPELAPYEAIAVAAGGTEVPRAFREQLVDGGRLVMPVGPQDEQVLCRVTRVSDDAFREERITDVRFVPLVGRHGLPETKRVIPAPSRPADTAALAKLIRETAEPIADIESTPVDALLDRIGDARLVLLGEATHGTSEFYRMRAHITKELIERRGFDFVAVEADWPDAARVDHYVLGRPPRSTVRFKPFSRFPTWMWRNEEVHEFIEWLREHNLEKRDPHRRVGFHGLDLYSSFTSIAVVLRYLDDVDPAAAYLARRSYALLGPRRDNPASYGRAVLVGAYESSEDAVVTILQDALERRLEYATRDDGEPFFDAAHDAVVAADAERYYRAMVRGAAASWNLRDTHMFHTLQSLLDFYGSESRGIVWEHNAHVGNALATEMSSRGELNVGQLCRTEHGRRAYLIGFGTHQGTVVAASGWDEPMQKMWVRPSHPDSYESIFHDSEVEAFVLHLRHPRRQAVRDELCAPRLQRAIGVVYRPETELRSHYAYARLPEQFDELIWFDESRAITPLGTANATPGGDLPETYPFGR